MNYDEFLKYYSLDFLSSIDINIHNFMLDKFMSTCTKKDSFNFIDVGCNAGSFIAAVKNRNIDVKVHAFEPHPYLFNYLTDTYPEHKINNQCVTNLDGKCKINIPLYSVGISSIINRKIFQELEKEQEIVSLECQSIMLDTYCRKNGIDYIDFIKIDVEGAEYFVFQGAKNLLDEKKIFCGQFEVGIDECGYNTQDLIDFLVERGYVVDKIYNTDYFFHI